MTPVSPVRILFLAANPKSTSRLALDEELRAIQQRLRLSGAADRFDLRAEWAVRADELPAALMRHKPRIVHYSGHGSESGEILLSSSTGSDVVPVSADTLKRLFRILSRDILCVVLNGCYTALQATALAEVLPCTVGMSTGISDSAAVAFAAGFYEALAFGQSLQIAFELGCTATELVSQGDQREMPQLHARAGVQPDNLYLLGAEQVPAAGQPGTSQSQTIGNVSISGTGNSFHVQQNSGGSVPANDPTQRTPSTAVRQPAGGPPTRASLRKLLGRVLPTTTDLDAFCLDSFPAVYGRFSTGMGRLERENLLLQIVPSDEVLASLRSQDPEGVANHASLLQYEVRPLSG